MKFNLKSAAEYHARIEKDPDQANGWMLVSRTSELQSRAMWPLPIWRFSGSPGTIDPVVSVPAGPWVEPILNLFKCWSCGCSCYTHADITPLKGERLLLYVYGKLVDPKWKGFYLVQNPKTSREDSVQRVAVGDFLSPIVDPSGCRVAATAVSAPGCVIRTNPPTQFGVNPPTQFGLMAPT